MLLLRQASCKCPQASGITCIWINVDAGVGVECQFSYLFDAPAWTGNQEDGLRWLERGS
jgi:hypothetical protein